MPEAKAPGPEQTTAGPEASEAKEKRAQALQVVAWQDQMEPPEAPGR